MGMSLKDDVRIAPHKKLGHQVPDSSAYKWREGDRGEKGRKVLYGLCGSCMTHDCATLVHIEDGVVVKIEGNREAPPQLWASLRQGELGNYESL